MAAPNRELEPVNLRLLKSELAETSKSRYPERVKELDLEDLACRQELAEVLELKNVSHKNLSRHHCVDWLKSHQAHFSRQLPEGHS